MCVPSLFAIAYPTTLSQFYAYRKPDSSGLTMSKLLEAKRLLEEAPVPIEGRVMYYDGVLYQT